MPEPKEVFVLTCQIVYEAPDYLGVFGTLEAAQEYPFVCQDQDVRVSRDEFHWVEQHGMWAGREFPDSPRFWSIRRYLVQ
jgi:hypothetical protein